MTWRRPDATSFDKIPAMILVIIRHLMGWAVSAFSSRENLILENLALRAQVLGLVLRCLQIVVVTRRGYEKLPFHPKLPELGGTENVYPTREDRL
jgi:hypothetical protein